LFTAKDSPIIPLAVISDRRKEKIMANNSQGNGGVPGT